MLEKVRRGLRRLRPKSMLGLLKKGGWWGKRSVNDPESYHPKMEVKREKKSIGIQEKGKKGSIKK